MGWLLRLYPSYTHQIRNLSGPIELHKYAGLGRNYKSDSRDRRQLVPTHNKYYAFFSFLLHMLDKLLHGEGTSIHGCHIGRSCRCAAMQLAYVPNMIGFSIRKIASADVLAKK